MKELTTIVCDIGIEIDLEKALVPNLVRSGS